MRKRQRNAVALFSLAATVLIIVKLLQNNYRETTPNKVKIIEDFMRDQNMSTLVKT